MNRTVKLKIFSLIIIAAIMLTALVGCKPAPPKDRVKDLAEHEKQWLTRLEPITNQIDKAYQAWTKGETDRERFTASLNETRKEFLKIDQEYVKYIEKNTLNRELTDKPAYKEGLVNGKYLRTDVNEFLMTATEGVENPQTKARIPLNDVQLKFFYRQKMIVDYNIHSYALKEFLKSFEQNMDKTQ